MSARVIPIRRGVGALKPLAKATPIYPEPNDGVHLIAEGEDWFLIKHEAGRTVSIRFTHGELLRVGDMIELVLATKEDA